MLKHPDGAYSNNASSKDSSADSKADPSAQHPQRAPLRSNTYAVQAKALKPKPSVQFGGMATQSDTDAVHQAAAHGIQGVGGTIPHLPAIQQSFGSHDVSSIQAHTGNAAKEANETMGSEAYATGNHVAFKGTPDLHTAAHEAAHVVQQRSGVSLDGGVGAVGDSYEQHADTVADAVVAGQSAEGLLGGKGGGGGAAVQPKAVQHKSNTTSGKTSTSSTTSPSQGTSNTDGKSGKDAAPKDDPVAEIRKAVGGFGKARGDKVVSEWESGEILRARTQKEGQETGNTGVGFSKAMTAGAVDAGVAALKGAAPQIYQGYFAGKQRDDDWLYPSREGGSKTPTKDFQNWLLVDKSEGMRYPFLDAMSAPVVRNLNAFAKANWPKDNTKLQEYLAIGYEAEAGVYGKFGLPQPEDKDEEHKKYKPKGILWTKLNGDALTETDKMGVTAKSARFQYTYEGFEHTTIVGETDASGIIEKIEGRGLKLKAMAGIFGRGATGESGRKVSKANLNASHLIADQFMGSGYHASNNLVTTSDVFNQKVMSNIEGQIRQRLEDFNVAVENALSANTGTSLEQGSGETRNAVGNGESSQPPSSKKIENKTDVTFNLTVDPTWVKVLDDQILLALNWTSNPKIAELHERIRSRHQGEDVEDMVGFIEKQLEAWMVGKSDQLKRIANVVYTLEIPAVGSVAGVNEQFFSGPDMWLGLDKMGDV